MPVPNLSTCSPFTVHRQGRFSGFPYVRLMTLGPISRDLVVTAGFARVELGPGLLREVQGQLGAVLGSVGFLENLPYKAPYQTFQFLTGHSAAPGLCPETVTGNILDCHPAVHGAVAWYRARGQDAAPQYRSWSRARFRVHSTVQTAP